MVALTGVEGVLEPVPSTAGTVSTAWTGAGPRRALGRLQQPAVDLVAAGAGVAVLTYVEGLPPVVGLLAPVGWTALLLACGAYDARSTLWGRRHRAGRVVRAGGVLGLGCWVGSVLALTPSGSEVLLLMLTVAFTTSTLVLRQVVQVAGQLRVSDAIRVVVVGTEEHVRRTIDELRRDNVRPFEVAGACLVGPAPGVGFDVPLGWGFEDLVPTARACSAAAVVVLPHPDLQPRDLQRLGWQLERTGIDLLVGTGLLDIARPRTTLVTAGGMRVLHVRHAVHRGPARAAKGLCERLGAALALLVLSPLLVTLALVVRGESSGSALFRQRRVGRDGRSFTMYKFRTMTTDAAALLDGLVTENEAHGVLFKIRSDPRVTRVGRVMRRYSLDELPQLANVVLGQMSLVGPRPALPAEVALYDHDPRRRLVVKPGLTGLWQVSGRSDLTWEETVRLDLSYVDNWSLGLDLWIVLRTVRAVLGHRGAY